MRTIVSLGAAVVAVAIFAGLALADTPPKPFPAPTVGSVFVAAQTVNTSGAMSSWFAPGSTVVFRAYAVDTKLDKVLAAKDVKYFYVAIPNQPTVKLKYNASAPGATPRMPWTGTWTVPATYPAGIVNFKILAKTNFGHRGLFVQMPVASAQLNISSTAPAPYGSGPAASGATAPSKAALALYVDSVNGTSPVGAAKRPIGCTQTNVFKRGEQVVFRVWGFDLTTGDTLSTDDVDTATATIPGLASPLTLGYGAHGATGNKVFFWSVPWIVPATFPLGDVTVHVAFKTDAGKAGTFDYPMTIVP